jgi:hypothetical protein
MNRSLRLFVVPTVALSLASMFLTWYLYADRTSWIPLSYELVATSLADNAVDDERQQHGIRSDGSTSRIKTVKAPDGTILEKRKFKDFAARIGVSIDVFTKSTTTYKISSKTADRSRIPPRCSPTRDAPRATFLGYETFLEVIQEKLSDGEIAERTEQWRAPALNCLPLQTKMVKFSRGAQIAGQIQRVTKLHFGEPPQAWFEVPIGYAERKPSEVIAEFRKLTSLPLPLSPTLPGRLDEVYEASRR